MLVVLQGPPINGLIVNVLVCSMSEPTNMAVSSLLVVWEFLLTLGGCLLGLL